jgi:hypothetical protein
VKRDPRLFPPVDQAIFDASADDAGMSEGERMARQLLALARRPMTRRQRILARGLDAPGLLGRALWLFREGMRAELAGRWGLADFYWRESRDGLRSLRSKPGAWDQIVRTAGGSEEDASGLPDANGWFSTLVAEVFIDTHCAFFNGRVPRPGVRALDHRAFDHVAAIEDCLTLGQAPPDSRDRSSLLASPWEVQLDLARAARQWDRAWEAVLKLRRLFPEHVEYLDDMVKIEVERSTTALVNSKYYPLVELRDADLIQEGIERLEAFRRQFPYTLSVFAALGKLHQLRAIKLAHGGEVSDALVEARMALTYAPDLDGVETTINDISEQLKHVIEEGLKIRSEVGGRDDLELTPEAQRLCMVSLEGFQPLKEYLESDEPEDTAKALQAARSHDLWRRVGLPPPAERFDDRALALSNAIANVLAQEPADLAEAQTAWSSIAEGDEILSSIDPDPVCRYLSSKMTGGAEAGAKQQAPGEAATGADDQDGAVPKLSSPSRGQRKPEEPFEFWLLSRRGKWLKFQTVAAVILVVLGIGLTVQRIGYRRARDEAYGRILRAQETRDYLEIIRGVEAFLAHSPLTGRDDREARILEMYDEALVRWVVARGAADDPEALEHLKQYRTLTARARS